MTKRTFIAIHIRPEEKLLRFILELQAGLGKSRINWVNPNTMHLTLRFFGTTSHEQIKQILKEAPDIFGRQKSFEIELKGLGKFGSTSNPKVLWIGFTRNDALTQLASQMEEMARKIGFDGEERDFRPHLTLGRVKWLKESETLKEKLETFHDTVFQNSVIDEVIFYESILKPAGPVYRPIQKFSLGEQ